MKKINILTVCFAALISSLPVKATVVEFRTVLGDFQVNLFDEITPITVQNFLDYVNSGAYANNVVHRSVGGFVVQGGGFTFNGSVPLDNVPTAPPIMNEPELSNVRGTIAMAKLGGDPDSATSQWFINLADNSASLDTQNGGFTAFGQVLGDGMDVVDAIAAVDTFNLGGAFSDLPLRDFDGVSTVTGDNLVIITDVVVVDANVVTNPDIVPVRNTALNAEEPAPEVDDSSGGGSIGTMMALLLGVLLVKRRLLD